MKERPPLPEVFAQLNPGLARRLGEGPKHGEEPWPGVALALPLRAPASRSAADVQARADDLRTCLVPEPLLGRVLRLEDSTNEDPLFDEAELQRRILEESLFRYFPAEVTKRLLSRHVLIRQEGQRLALVHRADARLLREEAVRRQLREATQEEAAKIRTEGVVLYEPAWPGFLDYRRWWWSKRDALLGKTMALPPIPAAGTTGPYCKQLAAICGTVFPLELAEAAGSRLFRMQAALVVGAYMRIAEDEGLSDFDATPAREVVDGLEQVARVIGADAAMDPALILRNVFRAAPQMVKYRLQGRLSCTLAQALKSTRCYKTYVRAAIRPQFERVVQEGETKHGR